MVEEEYQIPFLSGSKWFMYEALRKSGRCKDYAQFLPEFSPLQIQKIYMKIFNREERNYLEANWRKLGITAMLRTKYPYERLPENWFREND